MTAAAGVRRHDGRRARRAPRRRAIAVEVVVGSASFADRRRHAGNRARPHRRWPPPAAGALLAWIAPIALTALLGAAPAIAQPRSATDDAGRTILLDAPARRIVALAPHITEQLYAIGAGDRIVGTTEHADYPPAAARLPRVARAHSIDLEAIAATRPDLIVVWGSGYPPATVEALRRLRVPVYVNEPGALDSIASSLQRLGELTATTDMAERAAADFRRQLAALRQRYAGRESVRVFYQIWAQPLMTLSGRHVLSEAIRLCGGRNPFESLAAIAPQVSAEAVVAADPQLIVTAEPDGRPSAALDGWRRFDGISAVRLGQFAILDANRINRHAPRMLDEVGILCERIETARAALKR
jgi:iron complex transport system substrate-binding protein